MKKQEAIDLIGGPKKSIREVAKVLNVTYQAVHKWPDELSSRIADRVLAAWARKHVSKARLPDACK